MGGHPAVPDPGDEDVTYRHPGSVTTSIRLDKDVYEVLLWWARFTGMPLRSMIRQGIEAAADEIIAEYDPLSRRADLPVDVLNGHIYRALRRGPIPQHPVGGFARDDE